MDNYLMECVKMRVIEATKNRIVMRCKISKSGEKYMILFPAVISETARELHENGREVKVTIEVEGDEQ